MKVKVDVPKLYVLMNERQIKSLRQLAKECGLSECIAREIYRTGTMSKESMWLISDRLQVAINDFIYPEW